MKTKKLLWIFTALLMAATTVNAQGWKNGYRTGMGYGNGYGNNTGYGYNRSNRVDNGYRPGLCGIFTIPGLTEEQQTKITELEINHRKEMAELQVKQYSTTDITEKYEIREEMLKKSLAHRGKVRNLLNEEQQKHCDLHQGGNMYGCMGLGRGFRGGRGRGCSAGWGGRGRMQNGRSYYRGPGFREEW